MYISHAHTQTHTHSHIHAHVDSYAHTLIAYTHSPLYARTLMSVLIICWESPWERDSWYQRADQTRRDRLECDCRWVGAPTYVPTYFFSTHIFGTHLSVGGCQLTKERLLYSSDIRRSQFKVRVNKLDRSQ
jgi:hypothetical protein